MICRQVKEEIKGMDICYIKKKSLTIKIKPKHITCMSMLLNIALTGFF